MLIATGGMIVTNAEADIDGSATAVAVIVTCGGVGTLIGAVYRPSVVRVPHEDPVQPVPVSFQPTRVIVVPLTKARKRCCWLTRTVA
jgi:hypothetical protein